MNSAITSHPVHILVSEDGNVAVEKIRDIPPVPQDTFRVEVFIDKKLVYINGHDLAELLNETALELEISNPRLASRLFHAAEIVRTGQCVRCLK